MMKFLLQFYILFFLIFSLASCEKKQDSGRFKVVATTTMIADLVKNIGKDSIEVVGLMKAGVDPHLYKASEGDVTKLTTANAIFYNGLHLEGKMVDVFEKMQKSNKIKGQKLKLKKLEKLKEIFNNLKNYYNNNKTDILTVLGFFAVVFTISILVIEFASIIWIG